MKKLAALVVAASLVVGCGGAATAPPRTATPPPDFLVVGKEMVVGEGWYVTIIIAGEDRRTLTSDSCFRSVRVGTVLPFSCR